MSPSKKQSTKSVPATSRRRHIVGHASSSRVTKPNSVSNRQQAGFREKDLKPREPKASQDESSRYKSPDLTSSRHTSPDPISSPYKSPGPRSSPPLPTFQHWEEFGAQESPPAFSPDPSVASNDSFFLDPDTSWEDRIRVIAVAPEPDEDDRATEGECKEAEQEEEECGLQSKTENTTDAHQTAGKDRTSLVAHAIVYSTSGAMRGPASFPYLDVRLRCPQRLLEYYEDKYLYSSLKTGS